MRHPFLFLLFALAGALTRPADGATPAELAEPLRLLRAVGPEGQGNSAATAAWKQVAASPAEALPAVLAAMDGANELAMNYLRAAVDAMSARALATGARLPVPALEAFLADTTHQPRARRLAFELLAQSDPALAQRRLPGLLNDPSSELRRDAVGQLLQTAATERAASRNPAAVEIYQMALRSARDVDQIEAIAKALGELGQPADLPKVFGWLTEWKVVGPFDNIGRAGFERVFAPEQQIDLTAEYEGKAGKIRWQDHRATGDYGLLDLNQPCGALKEVTGYAVAEFRSATAQPVQLRLGCKNAWKVWLNGQLLFGREEYHRGAEIDQYRLQGQLKAGVNTILVKVCQNEQTEDWTKEWEFQLRVTDAQGTPIPQSPP